MVVVAALSRVDAITASKVQVSGSDASLRFAMSRGDAEWVDLCSKGGARTGLLTLGEGEGGRLVPPPAVRRVVRAWVDGLEHGELTDWDAGSDIGCTAQEILINAVQADGSESA